MTAWAMQLLLAKYFLISAHISWLVTTHEISSVSFFNTLNMNDKKIKKLIFTALTHIFVTRSWSKRLIQNQDFRKYKPDLTHWERLLVLQSRNQWCIFLKWSCMGTGIPHFAALRSEWQAFQVAQGGKQRRFDRIYIMKKTFFKSPLLPSSRLSKDACHPDPASGRGIPSTLAEPLWAMLFICFWLHPIANAFLLSVSQQMLSRESRKPYKSAWAWERIYPVAGADVQSCKNSCETCW